MVCLISVCKGTVFSLNNQIFFVKSSKKQLEYFNYQQKTMAITYHITLFV